MLGAFAIWQRDMLVFRRDILSEGITTIASPLTFLLIFGLGLGGVIGNIEGVPYVIFVVPGLISMTATMAAFDDAAWGMWFHREVQYTISEYLVNPITVYDVVFGKIISGLTKSVVKGLLVAIILTLLTGFRVPLANIPLYLVFIFLASAIFSSLGTIAGTVIDKPEQLGRLEAVIILPVIFLSGVFFSISAYPQFLQPIVKLLPTTAIFVGARAALLRGEIDLQFLITLIVTVVVSFVAAALIFDWKVED
ncbi:MAG: ABC transporter permease [Chloroflexi bacterium]|nr:ABC transporter permease [Chloroflexota bacterium]